MRYEVALLNLAWISLGDGAMRYLAYEVLLAIRLRFQVDVELM